MGFVALRPRLLVWVAAQRANGGGVLVPRLASATVGHVMASPVSRPARAASTRDIRRPHGVSWSRLIAEGQMHPKFRLLRGGKDHWTFSPSRPVRPEGLGWQSAQRHGQCYTDKLSGREWMANTEAMLPITPSFLDSSAGRKA